MKPIALNVIAVVLALVFIFPLIWMLLVSLKPDGVYVYTLQDWLKFTDLNMANYAKVLKDSQILRWTWNSFTIGVITTILSLFFSSLAAFSFSKLAFKSKGLFFLLIVSGLLIPTEAILIPLYETTLHLKLIDNIWAIILPGLTNPIGILLLKQFMDGVPKDYIEAAQIDGCRNFGLWSRICLPLTKSAMVSVGIFYFILSWNNFLWPYLSITSQENMILSAGLPTFLSNNTMSLNLIMAASAIAAIPTILVFVLLQRHIVQGVAMSGIKG
ncbi:sugar ABC transporter permease [Paenibacillus ferrarius]|uniref:Sugar ABC transporter permease n=1 Tax=Paenibacillus ferrarius TaxID=1469647 RepID=A0A1V4HPZ8_9BACL|nr:MULTISPECIES: carbohydrate ABC transporter permease [Paenibacillus]OPH59978.1 sugar ABC transporter permease [Paenibacillus ferrarius]UKS29712.1 carbohydrate ABC transporter permease [Paenibacillus sp. HWE-109]